MANEPAIRPRRSRIFRQFEYRVDEHHDADADSDVAEHQADGQGEPSGDRVKYKSPPPVLRGRVGVGVERRLVDETPTLALPLSTRGGEKSDCPLEKINRPQKRNEKYAVHRGCAEQDQARGDRIEGDCQAGDAVSGQPASQEIKWNDSCCGDHYCRPCRGDDSWSHMRPTK